MLPALRQRSEREQTGARRPDRQQDTDRAESIRDRILRLNRDVADEAQKRQDGGHGDRPPPARDEAAVGKQRSPSVSGMKTPPCGGQGETRDEISGGKRPAGRV
jgi:hypothetical protein